MSGAANFNCEYDGKGSIHFTGQADVTQYRACRWKTPDNDTVMCRITNTGKNDLRIAISGARSEILTTTGRRFSGLHVIPANLPDANVTALGDFDGMTVMITNISNIETTANILVVGF